MANPDPRENAHEFVRKIAALRLIEPEEPYIWSDHNGTPVEWYLEEIAIVQPDNEGEE